MRVLKVVLSIGFSVLMLTACLQPGQQLAYDALMQDRVAHNLPVLYGQVDAQAKAQAWAEKLARENTIYHSNLPDGINVKWCTIGENVGYGPNAQAIEAGYMASPGHRANILDLRWNAVGIGQAQNGGRVFTVQVFVQTC